jgi:hypothetical protein
VTYPDDLFATDRGYIVLTSKGAKSVKVEGIAVTDE